ncbi:MAG: hypothetical protein V4543_17630 [Bacteroidota bacterium]
MENYYLRLVVLAMLLAMSGILFVSSMVSADAHPALVSFATAGITAAALVLFLRKERAWRFLRSENQGIPFWLRRLTYKLIPRPGRRDPYRFTVRDKSISFQSPIVLHAIKSVHNTTPGAKLHRHEFYQTSSNFNLTVSCEYALYNINSRPNMERLIEKRVREYSDTDPAASGKYILSVLPDHEGIEAYLLNGCFINKREQFEYRAAYYHSGNRFWCVHILYPARNRNGCGQAMRLLNSIRFNFELPYEDIGDLNDKSWESMEMDNGSLTFRTPVELFRHKQISEDGEELDNSRHEFYSSPGRCNLMLECGFRETTNTRKVTLAEVVEEAVQDLTEEFGVSKDGVKHIRLSEFQVEGRWLQGRMYHNFHYWQFHQAVFALGNCTWYIRLRCYENLEGGYEAFENMLDSVKFDKDRLTEIINRMLDNYNREKN